MLLIFYFALSICAAYGAKILGVVLTPSYSHQIVFRPLWKELSLRGHHLTTITTHPIADSSLSNLTEIDLSIFLENASNSVERVINSADKNIISMIQEGLNRMLNLVDKQLDYPPVKTLINDDNAKFDLVIAEYRWLSVLAFAERFNCPSIGMLSVDASNGMYKTIGNPTHSSIYPERVLPFVNELSLFERVISFLVSFGIEWYTDNVLSEIEQKIIKKHFGSSSKVKAFAGNISLLFVNSDPIFHRVRPLVPAVIQIGGVFHPTSFEPLPKTIQLELDNARNGFIYFSLGSNVQSKFLPPESIQKMLKVFSTLPYTVLWKSGDKLPNKPKNIIFANWLPQQAILRHPNTKLFITQGGLQSLDEAIYANVPLIVLPFYGDQVTNAQKVVSKGLGLQLDYKNLNEHQFKEAILEVITNPKYRNTAKKLGDLRLDQPMSGLEKAIWWTEYVIRNKGAKHLRSLHLDISWYQYIMLDVVVVLILILSLMMYITYFMCKLMIVLVKKTKL